MCSHASFSAIDRFAQQYPRVMKLDMTIDVEYMSIQFEYSKRSSSLPSRVCVEMGVLKGVLANPSNPKL